MFCQKCGKKLENGATFCDGCGTPVQPAQVPNIVEPTPRKVKFLNKKTIGIIVSVAVAVVIILALVLVLTLGGAGNPEKSAEKYIEASSEIDIASASKYGAFDINKFLYLYVDAIESYAEESDNSEYFLESLEDEYGTDDIKEALDIMLEEQVQETKDELVDEYGADYEIIVSARKGKEITGDELEEKIEDFNNDIESIEAGLNMFDEDASMDDFYIDSDDVKKMFEVKVTVKIDGKEATDKETIDLFCIKIGGNWKVLTVDDLGIDLY